MQLEAFIADIRDRAGLLTREETLGAAEATLETLGEVLRSDARKDLARKLPDALASALERNVAGQRLDPDEFYERVTEREQQGRGAAMSHAEAVCQAFAAALSRQERVELRSKLPEDFRFLFEAPKSIASPPEQTGGAGPSGPEEDEEVQHRGDQVGRLPQNTSSADIDETWTSRKPSTNEPSPVPKRSPYRNRDGDQGRPER